MKETEISGRKLDILNAVIEIYVQTNRPVGSDSVCQHLKSIFSSATIRSEMAQLTLLGFLTQPHISAGRIPSHRGYRIYIDWVMKEYELSLYEKSEIDTKLRIGVNDPRVIIKIAAEVLTNITNYTAITTMPWIKGSRIYDIKFVKIKKNCALLILISTNGEVKNRLFSCKYEITDEIINVFIKVTKKIIGKSLENFVPWPTILSVKNSVEDFVIPVLDALIDAASEASKIEINVKGEFNIFENSDLEVLNSKIWRFLKNENEILKLLFSKNNSSGVFIGEEIGIEILSNFSLIKRNYSLGSKKGVMALITPIDLDYPHVLSKLKYMCSSVEEILKEIL